MKKIEAIIRPEKMKDIKDALAHFGINGMTVSEVMGCGLQKGWTETSDWQEYNLQLLSKVKIEIVVPDSEVQAIIDLLSNSARSGEVGDGKIFVSEIDDAIRIRTFETGDQALDSE